MKEAFIPSIRVGSSLLDFHFIREVAILYLSTVCLVTTFLSF